MLDITVVAHRAAGRALPVKARDRLPATLGLMCRSWHSPRSSIDACLANVSITGGCARATSTAEGVSLPPRCRQWSS